MMRAFPAPMPVKSEKGFSLVELMAVIALLALLIVLAAPMLRQYIDRAWQSSCLAHRYHINQAETQYLLERGQPSGSLQDLVEAKLLPKIPVCPAGGTYAWLERSPLPVIGCSLHFGAVPTPPGENVVFSTPFDSMAGLRSLRGNWKVVDGVLVPQREGENRLAFVTTANADYTVSVTATLTAGNGYGIYYRTNGQPNITGYVFQFDPGLGNRFVVRKVAGGNEFPPFQSVPMPAGFPVYHTAHQIQVSVQGDRHVIKVDGQTVLDFRDDTFQGGVPGLRSWSGTEVSFDAARVTVP